MFISKNVINKHRFVRHNLKLGLDIDSLNRLTKLPQIILNFNNLLLIPVPLHKQRFRWRGFNQSELIAKNIANILNLELSYSDLTRIKNTRPQAKTNKAGRMKNIKNSFIWNGPRLNQRNVLLLDDVATTGTTMNECAKVLKQAGANEIWGLAIAKN